VISIEDIEALAPELETVDRVIARVEAGVPAGREIMPNETMQFIRAAALMRGTLAEVARYMVEQHARELQSMSLGAPKTER